MKKVFLLPVLFLFAVLITSCKKDKEGSSSNDKAAAVAQTYQGKLSIGSVDFNNVKIKVTKKAANEVIIEPVSGQAYDTFATLTFSNFLYSDATKQYASSSGASRVVIFSFQSNSDIEMSLVNDFQGAMFSFEGVNVK